MSATDSQGRSTSAGEVGETRALAGEDKYDDYSLRTVPESEIKSTWDIALVRMGVTVSASDLVFGYTIGLFFSFGQAILIAVAYSVIIAIVSVLMGIIGVRERTSYALTSRFAFGREGSSYSATDACRMAVAWSSLTPLPRTSRRLAWSLRPWLTTETAKHYLS